jgi:hypothetical protein
MKAQWGTQGELNKSQGGLSGPSLLRSDDSRDSQAGRLDYVSSGQKQNQGGLLGLGPLRSDGSQVSLGRLGCVSSGQKTFKESPSSRETTRLQSTQI